MFLDKPEMRKYSKLLELSNIELPKVKMQWTSKAMNTWFLFQFSWSRLLNVLINNDFLKHKQANIKVNSWHFGSLWHHSQVKVIKLMQRFDYLICILPWLLSPLHQIWSTPEMDCLVFHEILPTVCLAEKLWLFYF